ncbi:MAG: hypothetical protein RLN82_00150 [Pseudomonadales bacterium]|uniref:hypothetical protein n=1 Tax=Ekhidna sp. TaxID=2608089 RepID=UPI0032EC317B
MAKRAHNTIKMSRNGKLNVKLSRSGFEELTLVIDRLISLREVKRTKLDIMIQASLMLELKVMIIKRGWMILDEYSLTWTVAQALTFFGWSNPEEELMEICPNIRQLNHNIHKQLL